jgi:sugar phosphate isomerase/epimerase
MNQPLPLGVTGVMLADLDFDEQIELCRSLNITHYVFRPRYIPDHARDKPYHSHGNHKFDLTPERLIAEGGQLRQKLVSAGMLPFCTVPAGNAGMPDEEFRIHLEGCAACGAERIKVTPIDYPRGVFDYEAYLERARTRYAELYGMAEAMGIKVVIEMHAGNSASAPGLAYNLVKGIDPATLGVIVDLPNFSREGFVAPGLALSVLRRWVDHVHIGGNRRTQGDYDRHGFRQPGSQMCALTESDLHIPAWLEAIAAANPAAPLIIEDYSTAMPAALKVRQNAEAITRLMRELIEGSGA